MGVPDLEIVGPRMDDEFRCVICLDLVLDPLQTPCSHLFCRPCILNALQHNQKCPKDNKPLSKSQLVALKEANPLVHRIIGKIQVRCPNHLQTTQDSHLEGCSWVGEYSERASHFVSCSWESVTCHLGCNVRFLRRNQQVHEGVCEFRQVMCQWCSQQMPFRVLDKHVNTDCAVFEVPCTNGCNAQVPRSEMRNHVDGVCPLTKLPCAFPGCSAKVVRMEMADHLETSLAQHLQLTLSLVKTQAQALHSQQQLILEQSQLIKTLQEKQASMCSEMEQLAVRRGCNQYTWKIVDWSSKRQVDFLRSDSFHINEYKFCLELHPNGFRAGKSTHLSLFIYNLAGEHDAVLQWPIPLMGFTVVILDQTTAQNSTQTHQSVTFSAHDKLERGRALGWATFLDLAALNSRQYVVDDTLFVKLIVKTENSGSGSHR